MNTYDILCIYIHHYIYISLYIDIVTSRHWWLYKHYIQLISTKMNTLVDSFGATIWGKHARNPANLPGKNADQLHTWGMCHDLGFKKGVFMVVMVIWWMISNVECPKLGIQNSNNEKHKTLAESTRTSWHICFATLQAPVSSLCGRSKVGAEEVGKAVLMMWSWLDLHI